MVKSDAAILRLCDPSSHPEIAIFEFLAQRPGEASVNISSDSQPSSTSLGLTWFQGPTKELFYSASTAH